MNAHKLAQQVVGRYVSVADDYQTHADNVQKYLRGPVQAVTLFIILNNNNYNNDKQQQQEPAPDTTTDTTTNGDVPQEQEKKSGSATATAADWRDYLDNNNNNKDTTTTTNKLPDLGQINVDAYETTLGRRTKARLEAFLTGVTLAVPKGEVAVAPSQAVAAAAAAAAKKKLHSSVNDQKKKKEVKKKKNTTTAKTSSSDIPLEDGLAGFGGGGGGGNSSSPEKERSSTTISSPVLSSLTGKNLLRSISSKSYAPSPFKQPQIARDELATRLELYIRSLYRVKAQGQECVVAAEPPRAMKARAQSVVVAFVDTVDTVQQQNSVLTRLLKCLTQELLAEDVLSENLTRVIRRLVSDYVQSVSFASLAFLSSPENSAYQRLTPMILKFLRYLQSNWQNCEADCEMERMLSLALDKELRQTFKTIEFRSIGHLLESCREFRQELQHIDLAPDIRCYEKVDDNDAVRQAIRDLQREVITVNGRTTLPQVKSRQELISFLSQTLNSRTLTSSITATPGKKKTRRSKKKKSRKSLVRRSESAPSVPSDSSEYDLTATSGNETDQSSSLYHQETSTDEGGGSDVRRPASRRRNFRLSTVDFLTKRLLLAASRTGTGGDAYFVVRDLFGGDDVEVVPSENIYAHGRSVRPGSIEILVRLASVTIKCHGSFDVYPKSLVGDCEPLIQLHTTTTETIALQEVRAADSNDGDGGKKDECYSSEEDIATTTTTTTEQHSLMVVQERKTDRTGWRTLSIRPALYEKYEEFSTPS